MTKRMLIDATHREETRVAITDGNRLVEYDYENQNRKPLKGNIFLAKVTRVEPSLQAAFVNFGGNRHGFLPFSEIHPDYFRIPVADREALMAEQEALLEQHDAEEEAREEELEAEAKEAEAEETQGDAVEAVDSDEDDSDADSSAEDQDESSEDLDIQQDDQDSSATENTQEGEDADGNSVETVSEAADDSSDEDGSAEDGDEKKGNRRKGRGRGRGGRGRRSQYRNKKVEVVGGEDLDPEQRFRFNLRRRYKIQEVIKRGQIMLVQVNKEERGNKGAAVGSYLSLPGRYCVLMPNSPRAGGVSRKIANYKDRARMREIVKGLDVPKGMSVIVRTAGVTRTKAEIKRDLDYLMRLWDSIRDLTLQSTAPSLVYEEADLIKRSVRDLYTRDIEEILVSGESGHKTAKDFMKMMIPSHVKKVKQYTDDQLPLFHRYQIESQINEIGLPEVRLKSGGYLVINPTEALVSVDVNSGKATKGRHIEETALKTNLEAADEVARQLRLRDLGGLVVIDFIDMENRRNNAKVERRMKEALAGERARVQVGRISSFGLMELSRQRLSPSLTEAQFETCKMCGGLGVVRTADAMSIAVLRAIEEEGIRARAAQIIVQVSGDVALYIMNYKRKRLAVIEERYGFEILLRVDDSIPPSEYRIEVSKPLEADDSDEQESEQDDDAAVDEEKKKSSRRRGRRGGRNNRQNNASEGTDSNDEGDTAQVDSSDVSEEQVDDGKTSGKKKPARRGRRKKVEDDVTEPSAKESTLEEQDDKGESKPEKSTKSSSTDKNEEDHSSEKPKKRVRKSKASSAAAKEKDEGKPVSKKVIPIDSAPAEQVQTEAQKHETVNQVPKEKKKGWWNKLT